MLTAIVGGNLQGVEAAYLAKKAGWEVIVIDRKPVVAAAGLCDRFVQLDISGEQILENVFKGVDLIVPALESEPALTCLNEFSHAQGFLFAFDLNAYQISSSKLKSDRLFAEIGVPAPRPWPECDFPVVAKPSAGSGSRGVMVFNNAADLQAHVDASGHQWVIQEYVQGSSYSIEIIGLPGKYAALQVTDLEMDADYDCKRVWAPSDLPHTLISEFENTSISIAEALSLKGLMDVEVIYHENTLKVLEIDARLPSQTPTAVYWSTGLNMVEMLANQFLNRDNGKKLSLDSPKGVIYEHIIVSPDLIEVSGEHIMSGADELHIQQDFFGADEAITNYTDGRENWVATLIISDTDRSAAWNKRNSIISDIKKKFKVGIVLDPVPTV